MKDSEILEAAKHDINRGYRICYAIGCVTDASKNQRLALIAWVAHMLGNAPYYETWMTKHHPILRRTMSPIQFQQARLVWMDWMIAQCLQEEAK